MNDSKVSTAIRKYAELRLCKWNSCAASSRSNRNVGVLLIEEKKRILELEVKT